MDNEEIQEDFVIGSKIIALFGNSSATVLRVTEQHIKKTKDSVEVDYTLVSLTNKTTTLNKIKQQSAVIFKTYESLQKHLEDSALVTIKSFVDNLQKSNEENENKIGKNIVEHE